MYLYHWCMFRRRSCGNSVRLCLVLQDKSTPAPAARMNKLPVGNRFLLSLPPVKASSAPPVETLPSNLHPIWMQVNKFQRFLAARPPVNGPTSAGGAARNNGPRHDRGRSVVANRHETCARDNYRRGGRVRYSCRVGTPDAYQERLKAIQEPQGKSRWS